MHYGDFLELAHQDNSGQIFFQRWVDDSKTASSCSTYKPFLRLLKTEVIADWASEEVGRLFQKRRHLAEAIVPTLLERVLLPVEHRRHPEVIKAFVHCYFPSAPQLLHHLDGVDWLGTIETGTILEQEERYGRELFGMSQALKRDGGRPWAVKALEQIARRRGLIDCPLASKLSFNIAFAFNHDSAIMRSAIIVPMSLLAIRDPKDWSISHAHVFAEDFLDAVELVRRGLVAGREISHDWSFLGNQTLSGSSGTMAIAVAQCLGMDYWKHYFRHTLPPWVVISASIDPQGHAAGGTAGEVGSLDKKSAAAIEEGVRVLVIVPDPTTPLKRAALAADGLTVLPLDSSIDGKEQVVQKLHEEKLVWAVRDTGMHPPVKILTDDQGDSVAWEAVQKCYSGMFPEEESIPLRELNPESAVLIAMFIGTAVGGIALVSGTPKDKWMFGSYLWIKDDFRSDLLTFFRNEIVAACRQRVPGLRGIIFEVDEPNPADVMVAADVPFDDRTVDHPDWEQIKAVVRQVRRVALYLRTILHSSCFMIVDHSGVPVKYRQPSMQTDEAKLCPKYEVPMYLMALFADETLRLEDLTNEGRDDAREALEYLLDTFWPEQSWASRECSRKQWPKYFAAMSRDLRSRSSDCKLAKWELPDDMHDIIRKAKRRPESDPECFDL